MAEKSMNEFPRELRGLYTKGQEALQRDNFDYAIDLFNQVLSKEPRLFEVRKALRMAQTKKAGNGSGFGRHGVLRPRRISIALELVNLKFRLPRLLCRFADSRMLGWRHAAGAQEKDGGARGS